MEKQQTIIQQDIDNLGFWCCHQKYTKIIMLFWVGLCAADFAHRSLTAHESISPFGARDNTLSHNYITI